MKYNSLQQAVIGVLQEKKIVHPNQQAIDVHEPEKDEITADDFKKLRSMKKTPSGKLHNCATHVEHSLYGKGQCIKEAHAEPDEKGEIAWYTVQFENGSTRKMQTESMKIVASESHKHESVEQNSEVIEEGRGGTFRSGSRSYYSAAQSVVRAIEDAARRRRAEAERAKQEQQEKPKPAENKTNEGIEQVDEISYQTKAAYYDKRTAQLNSGPSVARLAARGKLSKAVDSQRSTYNKLLAADQKKKMSESSNYNEELTLEDLTYEELQAFMQTEEFAQLDELSKKTLGSYAKKAGSSTHPKSASNLASAAAYKHASNDDEDDGEKEDHKSYMRSKGIVRAVDRLTREELEAFMQTEEFAQLDELSQNTLKNYMQKSRKQMSRMAGLGEPPGSSKRSKLLDKRAAGYRRAWAKREESVEESGDEMLVDEARILYNAFEVKLKESYTFGEYLTAAKNLVGEEQAVELANFAYQNQDHSIFVEEISHSAVEDKVKAHMAAGHSVSMPKYTTRDGKPRAEYVVTDKETGVRRRYIHQGNVTKMENMGARGKRDEK